MEDQLLRCSEQSMRERLLSGNVEQILLCIQQQCFEGAIKYIINHGGSLEDAEETVSATLASFWKKLKGKSDIDLTASVCGFFFGFVKKIWWKVAENKKKRPQANPFDSLQFFGDEDEDVFFQLLYSELLDAINACTDRMDEQCKIIILSDLYEPNVMDDELAKRIRYTNGRGVANKRNICEERLNQCLNDNYPGLFKHGIKLKKK